MGIKTGPPQEAVVLMNCAASCEVCRAVWSRVRRQEMLAADTEEWKLSFGCWGVNMPSTVLHGTAVLSSVPQNAASDKPPSHKCFLLFPSRVPKFPNHSFILLQYLTTWPSL